MSLAVASMTFASQILTMYIEVSQLVQLGKQSCETQLGRIMLTRPLVDFVWGDLRIGRYGKGN